jgi:hypothetical protein
MPWHVYIGATLHPKCISLCAVRTLALQPRIPRDQKVGQTPRSPQQNVPVHFVFVIAALHLTLSIPKHEKGTHVADRVALLCR